jgi:2-methylcitrate dehydratase
MPETVHQRLARRVHEIRFEALPSDVVRTAETLILDSLGCTIGGLDSGPAKAIRRVVDNLGGRPVATLIGTDMVSSVPLAVLANGTALRYLDFNDAYGNRDTSHPSANLPVVMAFAEAQGLSGRRMIEALVAAYEVHLRLCDFAGAPSLKHRGFHHSTNLAFAAAAGAARLLSDDPMITAQAMAIAATHQNGLAQIQHGNIPTMKASAEGFVAKSAVEAVLLALNGITGPDEIFEGAAGWTAVVAGDVDYEGLVAPVGQQFGISKVRIKPYAAVGPAAAPIAAAIEIFATGRARPEEIEKIVVKLNETVLRDSAVDEAKRYPPNRETADHSFHYCTVIALIEGACGEAQYAPEKLASPLVRELLAKVSLVADPEISALRPRVNGGGVAVTLRDGSLIERRFLYPPGHPANPLSAAQVVAKFEGQVAGHFAEERMQAIKSTVFDLDRCDRISDFTRLLKR